MHPVFVGLAASSELLGGVTAGVGGSDWVKPAVIGIGGRVFIRYFVSDLLPEIVSLYICLFEPRIL